ALLLVGAQSLIDFPLVVAWESANARQPAAEQSPAQDRDDGGNRGEFVTRGGRVYRVRHFVCAAYTPWFALAVLGTGWALFLTGVERWHDRRCGAAPPPCEPDTRIRSP